jgi:hypothetical protein
MKEKPATLAPLFSTSSAVATAVPAGGDEVVDNQNTVIRRESVLVDLELIRAVLECVGLRIDLARKLAGLSCRDKASIEPVGDRGAHEEAAGLSADDLRDALVDEVIGDIVDGCSHALGIGEQRGDVLEDDAWFRIVRNADNQALVIDARQCRSFPWVIGLSMFQDILLA